MNIKQQPTAKLIPYINNARTHSDEQVAQIAASIREFGFNNPVLVDKQNTIIAGHGRVMAAKLLDIDTVPTICLDHLTEDQRKAYILADNKLAMNAGWDNELLKLELGGLIDNDFNIELIGFGDDELAHIMLDPTQGLTDEDDVPDAPETPITVTGDVWLLGKHRILCGDSTNASDVSTCLNGVKPHLMVTDPPYGVEYDASWREGASAVGKVTNDDNADWRETWALFPGDVAYVWHADLKSYDAFASLVDSDFQIKAQIIWAKNRAPLGRGHYHFQHEPCFYAVRKNKTGHWAGDRKQSTVWNIDKPMKSETGHSTQKPVECMQRPIENNSSPGQAVYEPFSGSGTTIIAAENTGRVCYAIEIEPLYVDIAVKRWQEYTGEDAVLESSGQTYNEIANAKTEAA